MSIHVDVEDKWRNSRALLERAKRSLAGGVSSPFRAKAPVPLYFEDGCGCKLRDVDGNEYIDYALAWGPLILGHRHPCMVDAIRRQADRPHTYGAQHRLEFEVSELFQICVPCAERVSFTSSGSEAVQLALRLARAFTNRRLIVKFEGHYHGWLDSVLISYHPAITEAGLRDQPTPVPGSRGQVMNATENVIVLPWNRADILAAVMDARGHEVAAVITEPVLCNSGCILPLPGYLNQMRSICEQHRALLIFDEVITGFRTSIGGAQDFYGVTPDLATFGKALGAGLPISAIAGRKEIFDLMFGGGVAYGGTFNGNPLSLAGAKAALTELAKNNSSALRQANERGDELKKAILRSAEKHGVPLQIQGFGAAFALHFTQRRELRNYRDTLDDDLATLNRFLIEALKKGIYMIPDGRVYVSAVHDEADIEETAHVLDGVLAGL
jgi:glutamate-1-semialdehyde 2,1-aminomutase